MTGLGEPLSEESLPRLLPGHVDSQRQPTARDSPDDGWKGVGWHSTVGGCSQRGGCWSSERADSCWCCHGLHQRCSLDNCWSSHSLNGWCCLNNSWCCNSLDCWSLHSDGAADVGLWFRSSNNSSRDRLRD